MHPWLSALYSPMLFKSSMRIINPSFIEPHYLHQSRSANVLVSARKTVTFFFAPRPPVVNFPNFFSCYIDTLGGNTLFFKFAGWISRSLGGGGGGGAESAIQPDNNGILQEAFADRAKYPATLVHKQSVPALASSVPAPASHPFLIQQNLIRTELI